MAWRPDQFDDEDGIGDERDDTPNAAEVPEEPDSDGTVRATPLLGAWSQQTFTVTVQGA